MNTHPHYAGQTSYAVMHRSLKKTKKTSNLYSIGTSGVQTRFKIDLLLSTNRPKITSYVIIDLH